MRDIEEPVTVTTDRGTITTHPAFGQIAASRVQGHSVLYDSDFPHNATMRISISHSELRRDLNRDWHFGGNVLIEVELSEAQWATFISSANIGSGPPCTIRFTEAGGHTPALPDPADRGDQFKAEMAAKLAGNIKDIRDMLAKIDAMGLPKGKKAELREMLDHLLTDLRANLPFVARSFGEHVEETVEKAKQEIHGYMTNVINRAGITALQQGPLPLQIEVDKED